MPKKGCCRECKYADWDADGCTCMIDGRSVYNASDYTCDQYRPAKPLTNADRIRQMTDEELAEFIDIYDIEDICKTRCEKTGEARERCMCYGEQCVNNILQWLKQEVSEDAAD